jgi:hypothetical protein
MAYRPQYEEKYIPDMSVLWTPIGIAPFAKQPIMKINNTLYAFGCVVGGTSSSYIYSTAWDNPTGWVSTGVSVAGFHGDSTIGIVDDTIYFWGTYVDGHVFTAPVSDPLVWTDTGLHLTATARDYSALIITPKYVCMYAGHKGAAAGNIAYAPVATPTTFSTGGTIAGWETCGCYLDKNLIHVFGGYAQTSTVWSFMADSPTKLAYGPSYKNTSIRGTTAVFHVEDKVHVPAYDNFGIYSCDVNNLNDKWVAGGSVFSVQFYYHPPVAYARSCWIGPDGYAYVISSADYHIWRSGRKKIYVYDPPSSDGRYTHRRAVTDTGGESVYTVHCQMGMTPWHTNRRDKF